MESVVSLLSCPLFQYYHFTCKKVPLQQSLKPPIREEGKSFAEINRITNEELKVPIYEEYKSFEVTNKYKSTSTGST